MRTIWAVLTWPWREKPWRWRPYVRGWRDPLKDWRLGVLVGIDWQNDEYDFDEAFIRLHLGPWALEFGLAYCDKKQELEKAEALLAEAVGLVHELTETVKEESSRPFTLALRKADAFLARPEITALKEWPCTVHNDARCQICLPEEW